jgi:hypothetical protein
MLPLSGTLSGTTPASISSICGCVSVPVNVRIAVDIRVPVKTVIYIDVNIIASPTGVPSPAATTPEGAHRKACTPRNRSARVIAGRRIINRRIWINRRTVNDDRIVARYVDNFRIRLLNNNNLFFLNHLGFHFHLLTGFQVPLVLSFLTHPLHSIHDVTLLC